MRMALNRIAATRCCFRQVIIFLRKAEVRNVLAGQKRKYIIVSLSDHG
jgi:hypothetical protein